MPDMNLDALAERTYQQLLPLLAGSNIPCMALGVVNRAGETAIRWQGDAQRQPQVVGLEADFWFDLASLTKVIFTTTQVLAHYEQGTVALDDPISAFIPDLRQYDLNAKERRLTIRELLSHNTCLPAVEPVYSYGLNPLTTRAFVLQRDWQATPAPVYSDINFMLLGIMLERLAGKPLQDILPPNPGLNFSPPVQQSVATEFCTWRNRMIRGEVHDENASAFGGVAGHAGLFGTIHGVLAFASSLLSGTLLHPDTLNLFKTRFNRTRTLGWESQHPGWHGGDLCSGATIGHTGFTGTGLWIDLEAGLGWTLLTNRVHPSRHQATPIQALRRLCGNALFAATPLNG